MHRPSSPGESIFEPPVFLRFYGGVILITSQGNRENVSKGTKAMVAAVTGLVIAFSGYALITFLSQSVGVKSEFLLTPQNTATKK